jgi:hypothetical protein
MHGLQGSAPVVPPVFKREKGVGSLPLSLEMAEGSSAFCDLDHADTTLGSLANDNKRGSPSGQRRP